jgi:hypothetical protein
MMNVDKITYKGRERLKRGTLKSFTDLPVDIQKKFINIRLFLVEYFGNELEVYVHGSYKHGCWDELSDYDVIIYEKLGHNIDNYILENIGVKANVFSTDNKIGVILIP